MLIAEGTGEGIAREAEEKRCCSKAKNTLMIGMAMAAAMGPSTKRWTGMKESKVYAGVPHNNARPDKKAKRKRKQASRRMNRKK